MKIKEVIFDALSRENLTQQELAEKMQVTQSKLSRLLQKPESKYKIGEIENFARGLNLKTMFSLYGRDPLEVMLQNAWTMTGCEGTLPEHLEKAIELNLQRKMQDLHPLERHEFNHPVAPVVMMGWHLGRSFAVDRCEGDPEELQQGEVYWCVACTTETSQGPGLLFFRTEHQTRVWPINHAHHRLPLLEPTRAGRTYLELHSDFAFKQLSPHGGLLVDRTEGEQKISLLMHTPPKPEMDPYQEFHNMVQSASEPCRTAKTTTLEERLHWIHRAYELKESERLQDLCCWTSPELSFQASGVLEAISLLNEKHLNLLAVRYGVSAHWLATGEGKPHAGTLPMVWDERGFLRTVHQLQSRNALLGFYLLHTPGMRHLFQVVLEETHPQTDTGSIYRRMAPVDLTHVQTRLKFKALLQVLQDCHKVGFYQVQVPPETMQVFEQGGQLLPELLFHRSCKHTSIMQMLNGPLWLPNHDPETGQTIQQHRKDLQGVWEQVVLQA